MWVVTVASLALIQSNKILLRITTMYITGQEQTTHIMKVQILSNSLRGQADWPGLYSDI